MGKFSHREQERSARQSEKVIENGHPRVEHHWVTGSLQKILRRVGVEQATGLARATIYNRMAQGKFPRPIKLSERSVGWLEAEIIAWQKARIAERDIARLPPVNSVGT
jgi:prophage regulatory protein